MKRPYRIERWNGTRWRACSSAADIERAKKIMVRAAGEWNTLTRIVDTGVRSDGPVLYLCVHVGEDGGQGQWKIV